jgi:NAD(P)H-hydrate epimerase
MKLPEQLYTAAQVRELDRIAIEDYQIKGLCLMERAGWVTFQSLKEHFPNAQKIAVVCGIGNNAGDGYVIARLCAISGLNVQVFQIGDLSKLKGDALLAFQHWEAIGGKIDSFDNILFEEFDLIVDAIFGTGLDRNVEGIWQEVIEKINLSQKPVLAVDIPSGLNANTGTIQGIAIKANLTVTFIGLKAGLFTNQAVDYVGKIIFNDLQIPPQIYQQISPFTKRISLKKFPPRQKSSHKGTFGHVLIVGGEIGMSGAARLAGEAAARVGVGKISIATRSIHSSFLNLQRPELMVHPVENIEDLQILIDRCDVIAIGTGLGQNMWGEMMLSTVLKSNKPLILDADALNLLSKNSSFLENAIITPHPTEAARLLNKSTKEIQNNRFESAKQLFEKYQATCVLKGAGTVICSEQGLSLCDQGNAGLASGGTGDVLTGIIAGLVTQGLDLISAAEQGVCLHANAADLAAQNGERGLLASDLFLHLKQLVN